ncbi:hypothetical protein TNCV_2979621 [Trichonephila clavipes]|nr:hypothetical protein TNCV_2979621 [Trichonephila clavipes]
MVIFDIPWKLNITIPRYGYIQLLGDYLKPFVDFMYPNNDGIFMEGNTLCHRVIIARNSFEEHFEKFQRKPSRSPDTSPTEYFMRYNLEVRSYIQNPTFAIMDRYRGSMAPYFC